MNARATRCSSPYMIGISSSSAVRSPSRKRCNRRVTCAGMVTTYNIAERQSRMRPEVTALFRELADRSPEEREEYYTREGVAGALREELESLLQYDRPDDSLRGYVDSAQ